MSKTSSLYYLIILKKCFVWTRHLLWDWVNAAYHHYILEGNKNSQISDSRGLQINILYILLRTYFLHPTKKLVCSCVVPLGFCEQLAQALDRKWNSKIEGERKKIQYTVNWKILIQVVFYQKKKHHWITTSLERLKNNVTVGWWHDSCQIIVFGVLYTHLMLLKWEISITRSQSFIFKCLVLSKKTIYHHRNPKKSSISPHWTNSSSFIITDTPCCCC